MEKDKLSAKKAFVPIILIFVLVNAFLLIWNKRLEENAVNTVILQAGNFILFLIFLLSTWLQHNAMRNKSTSIFLRNVYSGMLLKLFGCAIAAFIYIFIARENVNKPALFGCMFLYMLYTFIELRVVLKQSKSA
ncbi:hypothetical protein [Flavihumibacter profundi]|uniref:hypothetical protein n=1 Tax=Flavihumibacter profundi TaxID=2716883 RepID=UPI001CC508AB|nr:hypothetical protein [Flavihumibacter profundi]MBZ5856724.1 hypothetical protein [Flavihumibacter profundi]